MEASKGALYPVLPLRDIVVFPHMIVPLFVGREKSVRALEDVMKEDKQILLVAQKNAGQDDPMPDDIHSIHVLGDQSIMHLHMYGKALEEMTERVAYDRENGTYAVFPAHREIMDDPGEG